MVLFFGACGAGSFGAAGNFDEMKFGRPALMVTRQKAWTGDQLSGMGLHRLQGTVCYPSQATSIRSSLSCVRENRTHSLKGGYMETGQR